MPPSAFVSRLFVYPVKSLAGVEVSTVELDSCGVRGDRRWMVVTPDGQFVTQRQEPRLALLHPSWEDGTLLIRGPSGGEASLEPATKPTVRVTVRDDTVDAVPADPAANRWVSSFLGRDCVLAYLPENSVRYASSSAPPGTRIGFQDAYPLLVIGQAAVDELSRRMRDGAPRIIAERFRPNVVIDGIEPHAEDGWRRVRLGDIPCAAVKLCARCVVTTVDPETGRTGREPLRTLATYRSRTNKVWFGTNLVHLERGSLAVGAPVEVLEHVAA